MKTEYRANDGPFKGHTLLLGVDATTAWLHVPGRYRGRYVPLSPEPGGSLVRWEPRQDLLRCASTIDPALRGAEWDLAYIDPQ